MMRSRTVAARLAIAGAIAAASTVGVARLIASDPIGLYAIIDKVVVEPAQGPAQRIQVWGAFAVADTRNQDDYATPQKGYLYFSCPPQQESTCRNEWADLQSVAGKGVGVGFGGRHISTGRVRDAGDKPASPDVYPIRMGVVKMERDHQRPIVARLKAALVQK
jgi:hypothetical protein